MEFQFKGANCIQINANKHTLLTDANIAQNGLSVSLKKVDVVLSTQRSLALSAKNDTFEITDPGEYEVAGFAVVGIPARSHTDETDQKSAVIFRLTVDGMIVCVTGHIYPQISEDDLEAIGIVDVLVIPVGGHGYTLDAIGAASVVRKISPKIVVPTHYALPGVKYPVPQDTLEGFIKEMGGVYTTEEKLKIKSNAMLPENTQVIELRRT